MRESVSAILIHEDEFFIIQRQNYLKAFGGYYSFPGGKVDKADHDFSSDLKVEGLSDYLLIALKRELEEELGISIEDLFNKGEILGMSFFATAITPDFNPHRFKNHYIKIFCKHKPNLKVDSGEAQFSGWINCHDAFKQYRQSHMLVVPPMISIMEDLDKNILSTTQIDPNLKYDSELEVPLLHPLGGIKQFLPLSNTFPPANRTNCFLIGDDKHVLIDPSPKCLEEYEKLKNSLKGHRVDEIFITHHHPDHHQYATRLAKELGVEIMISNDSHSRLIKKFGADYFSGIKVNYALEGDVLTHSNGHKVLVIETPGHDEGQLSLICEDKSWAIVSDLIQTVGTVLVGGEEGDMNKYFRSLERVIELRPKTIFPSHGIGVGGVHRLKQTLKHRLEREQQVYELMLKGISSSEILVAIYSDLPQWLHKYALLTIESHIKKIQDYGLS